MARKKQGPDKLQYLKEHVAYERTMLGYTYARLHDTPEPISWNVVYESFGIHARNLYHFFRNEGLAGNHFKAGDYVNGWSPSKPLHSFTKLNAFLFHMSTDRTVHEKMNLARLQQLGSWLDTEWVKWAAKLPSPYREIVTHDPVCITPLVLQAGVTLATACTTFSSTNTTNAAGVAEQNVEPYKS